MNFYSTSMWYCTRLGVVVVTRRFGFFAAKDEGNLFEFHYDKSVVVVA